MRALLIVLLSLIVVGCKSPDARKPISAKSGTFIKESVERTKILNNAQHETIKDIIKKDTIHNYIASQSGFWYYYNTKIESDTLIKPTFGDIVSFDYNLKSLKGQLIYSKEELKPQTYAMDREEIFTGLREGLKLLKAGESATFLFPSQKAYGYYGDENRIGLNTPLMCEVTVREIIKNKSN